MRVFAIVILILISFSCSSHKTFSESKPGNKINENAKQTEIVNGENKSQNETKTKTLYVASYKKDCEGVARQTCYLVKENPEDDWKLFYSQIEGFDYEAGKVYTLTVEIIPVKNPPADASMFKYKLVSVDRTDIPDYIASGLYDIWGLLRLNGEDVNLKEQIDTPMIEINTRENSLSGSTGCNRFNATFEYNMNDYSFNVIFPIGMTKRGCPENGIESEFLKTLELVDEYSKKGITLYLLADGKQVMEFRRMD